MIPIIALFFYVIERTFPLLANGALGSGYRACIELKFCANTSKSSRLFVMQKKTRVAYDGCLFRLPLIIENR